MTQHEELLKEVVGGAFLPKTPDRIGIAVSGGGDSMALMVMLAELQACLRTELFAVTVNHGLRPEARQEALLVAETAADLGIKHDILTWSGWDGQGNLQDRARRARYDLLADWARRRGIPVIALAHTADDQAETVLMRLARASGADGLSAMSARRRLDGVTLVRPMLTLRRSDLRDFLRVRGRTWVEDPSNSDSRYERVRIREAMTLLEPLGLTVPALCNVADNLSSIRETLNWYTFTEARGLVGFEAGDLLIARAGFRLLRPEIARRLLQRALMWVGGAEYPPRRTAMHLLQEAISAGTGMTLMGCRITVDTQAIRIFREFNAVAHLSAPVRETWDGRWKLDGPWPDAAEIAVLGEAGLAECPAWRDTGLPRASLLASPAVWHRGVLIAAPLAGRAEGWTATLVRDTESYFAALLTD